MFSYCFDFGFRRGVAISLFRKNLQVCTKKICTDLKICTSWSGNKLQLRQNFVAQSKIL